jgi:uncharacterized protein YegP (UPF0339 family)
MGRRIPKSMDLTFFNFKMSAHNILFESEGLVSRLNVALKEV